MTGYFEDRNRKQGGSSVATASRKLQEHICSKNIVFNKPLFPNSALNRITNTPPLSPYSLILANKGIRDDVKCNNIYKNH